ncbi:hypothetical protein CH371_18325 [Leptospira wolffii]|uniref:Transposase n=1 Tax=Leptospira wolffii TaxID=409998 RepID=A0A2M9Z7H6_9LEPT|nr:hypothetical protein CH371_18325 [Leptospira wolffii]
MSNRGKYFPEFKKQAVKRTLSGSFIIKEISQSLGISYLYCDNRVANCVFFNVNRNIIFTLRSEFNLAE